MDTKHFVLVHGACHGAWIWENFTPKLKAHGHRVTVVDLAPPVDDPNAIEHIPSANDYSQPLLNIINSIKERVILVVHGMGGINAAIAADSYQEKIAVIVFVNAFMPDTTHKPSYVLEKYMKDFHDWKDSTFRPYTCSNKCLTSVLFGHDFLKSNLYQESPPLDCQRAFEKKKWGSFFIEDLKERENFTERSYGLVDRISITSKDDKMIPPEFQNWQTDNFKVKKPYDFESGDHMLMFSRPEELANSLLDIANEYA